MRRFVGRSGSGSIVLAALAMACGGGDAGEASAQVEEPPAKVVEVAETPTCRAAPPVPIYEDGKEIGLVCPDDAARRGLTLVDLSDDWVPLVFRDEPIAGAMAEDPRAQQPYRATYVALANRDPATLKDDPSGHRDGFLELFGVFPSFRVVAGRLLDDERHACAAALDVESLAQVKRTVDVWYPTRTRVEREAVAVLDARLVCERLLKPQPPRKPRPRWRLQNALAAFQRSHVIVSRGVFDAETRRAIAADSRELDFRAVLRALRARVVDATGLLEDGTARNERGTVLDRRLDGDAFYVSSRRDLREDGAPDLISPATEAAARALGWTDPAATVAFFRDLGPDATATFVVALRLPPPPAYHSAHMEVRAEIDRGDVWYELPQRRGRIEAHPTLTLFARDVDGTEIALVRWRTTIGGWKKEVTKRGTLALKYKNSDVGVRVWRDLVASPAWLPPAKTPPRTLVRLSEDGKWIADTSLAGPGYASAYGLVALTHHQPVRRRGKIRWDDNGIRTHGSVSYDSILRAESHGCHRLFNQSAVQLGSFLLRHRNHVSHGNDPRRFAREFIWKGKKVTLPIPYRGYTFELTPPVSVEVLPGNVRGKIRKVPGRFVSLRAGRPN